MRGLGRRLGLARILRLTGHERVRVTALELELFQLPLCIQGDWSGGDHKRQRQEERNERNEVEKLGHGRRSWCLSVKTRRQLCRRSTGVGGGIQLEETVPEEAFLKGESLSVIKTGIRDSKHRACRATVQPHGPVSPWAAVHCDVE